MPLMTNQKWSKPLQPPNVFTRHIISTLPTSTWYYTIWSCIVIISHPFHPSSLTLDIHHLQIGLKYIHFLQGNGWKVPLCIIPHINTIATGTSLAGFKSFQKPILSTWMSWHEMSGLGQSLKAIHSTSGRALSHPLDGWLWHSPWSSISQNPAPQNWVKSAKSMDIQTKSSSTSSPKKESSKKLRANIVSSQAKTFHSDQH